MTYKINLVIPMAGAGSRFAKAGFKHPKPLIPVNGRPMIQLVCENLQLKDAHFIFIVQKAHYEVYGLRQRLEEMAPGCDIVQIDGLTAGAACSVLAAKEYIDNDLPLMTANSDQFMEWDAQKFVDRLQDPTVDGVINTIPLDYEDNKWSFAKTNEDGVVVEVREKLQISNHATTGIYLWRRGADFVRDAEAMIAAQEKSNNEYYVAPVYNWGIKRGLKFLTYDSKRTWGLGIPDDLEYFLKHHPA